MKFLKISKNIYRLPNEKTIMYSYTYFVETKLCNVGTSLTVISAFSLDTTYAKAININTETIQ